MIVRRRFVALLVMPLILCVVVVAAAGVPPQYQVHLWFDMNRAYLFDRKTEEAL